jgi:hypothetical protein
MWSLLYVVRDVGLEHSLEGLTAVDQHVVEAVSAHGPHNRSAKALARGARRGVRITLAPSVSNTWSNGPETFLFSIAEQEPDVL